MAEKQSSLKQDGLDSLREKVQKQAINEKQFK